MPKMKTHSSAKKRFRVTGKGKLRRHRASMSHFLGKKSPRRIREGRQETEVDKTNEKQIFQLLSS